MYAIFFCSVKTWDGAVSQLSSSASSGLMGMNGSANGRKRDQYNDLLDFGKVSSLNTSIGFLSSQDSQ